MMQCSYSNQNRNFTVVKWHNYIKYTKNYHSRIQKTGSLEGEPPQSFLKAQKPKLN